MSTGIVYQAFVLFSILSEVLASLHFFPRMVAMKIDTAL